jgi:hypothetical protein
MQRFLSAVHLLKGVLLTAVLFGTVHATASAQDGVRVDGSRLYGGVWLGFLGDAQLPGDEAYRVNVRTTVGGQFGLDVVGSRNFSLGAEARIGAAAWKVGDRTKLIDLALKPRLRLPVNEAVEFYFAVPVGLTVPRLSDTSEDAKVGWNLGAGGGLNLFLTESFGVNVEPMWLRHSFKVAGAEGGDMVIKQFALFLNAIIEI